MDSTPDIRPARLEEREAALRLIFQPILAAERETRVANALHLLEAGQLHAEGLLVAADSDGIRGAMVCLPVAGASGLVWPPQVVPGPHGDQIEDALVRSSAAWLRERGARLGQCLLPIEDVVQARPLERNGFRHITTLWYMRHEGYTPLHSAKFDARLHYRLYDPASPELFHETLLRTYGETLDCPEVNGIRTIHEIIDGHKSDARSGTESWWLALDDVRPVGVLLVADSLEWSAWEIAYVGVVPEARRRGIGRQLVLKAVIEAQRAEVAQLTLSVDARNRPAIALYRQLGFERFDSREVFLAVWSPAIR
jgi:ribosomal protein S18 acetylase RimI-like enzyme